MFSGVTSEKTFDQLQFQKSEPLQKIEDVCKALGTNVYEVNDVKPLKKYLNEKNDNQKFAFKMTKDSPNDYRIYDTSCGDLFEFNAPVNYSCTVLCTERVINLTWLYILASIVVAVILIVGGMALRSKMKKRKIEVSLFHT